MRSTDPTLLGDARGSATSEGVIVAPVLVLLFASVIWAGARYATERRNAAEAHRQPWAPALVGCSDGVPDPAIREALSGYAGRLAGTIPRLAGDVDRVVVARIERERSDVVDRPAPLGGGTFALREETRVSCNPVEVGWTEDDLEEITRDEFCRLTPYCDP